MSLKTTQVGFDPQNTSAFGTLETGELTPVIQSDRIYGINNQKRQQSYVFVITSPAVSPTNGALYTNSNQTFVCIRSATTTFVAYGSGVPAASGTLTKVSGTGDATLTYSAYSLQNGIVNGTGATVDTDSGRLRIQSGTTSTGYAYIHSRNPIKYRAGQGCTVRITPIFTAGVANNIQLRGALGMQANAVYDGYAFGYNGTSFGIVHYIRGSATWTAQGSRNNLQNLNRALDPTKGSPCMIKYPYLGYGTIEFFIEAPTGGFVLVHTINYPNTVNTTQLSNPTLYLMGYTLNSGNTTNQIMYCGSVGAFLSGVRSFIGNPKYAVDSNKAGITTENNLVSVRNCFTYNGVLNRCLIRLQTLSVGCGTTTNNLASTFRIKIGAQLGGTPSYTAISGTTADNGVTITSGNSIASYDTAGTTITGGIYQYNVSVGSGGSVVIDLTPMDLFIAPGEVVTVSGFASGSATLVASLNRSEDI